MDPREDVYRETRRKRMGRRLIQGKMLGVKTEMHGDWRRREEAGYF